MLIVIGLGGLVLLVGLILLGFEVGIFCLSEINVMGGLIMVVFYVLIVVLVLFGVFIKLV